MISLEITPIENVNLYQFGSSLYSDEPNDIDLAIIYNKDHVSLEEAITYRKKVQSELSGKFKARIDIILLSINEEREAEFLMNAKHKLIF